MIVVPFIIGLFVLLDIILSMGKGAFLIAGFNTLSKEEKKAYDVISLCKFMGKVMFMIDFCITLFLLSDILKRSVLFNIGLILFFITLATTIIYSSTGNRFKK
ncbi:DUF3784 domain-containing protein [Clostridium botulinum]